MENSFTKLQGQYLAFIAAYTKVNGRSPAEADLQRYFGVAPPSVHNMVLTHEKRGLIARTPGRARSTRRSKRWRQQSGTLLLYLKARIPFICLRTDERDRALELSRELVTELNVPVYYHTLSQGIRDIGSKRVVSEDRSVAGALDYASQQFLQRQNLTFVLTEVQDLDGDTAISRQMLDVVSSATERGGVIVVITTASIWPRLQRQGMTLELDPPNEDEMRLVISECLLPYRGSVPIEWGDAELFNGSRDDPGRRHPDRSRKRDRDVACQGVNHQI